MASSYRLRFQAIGRVIRGLTIPPTFHGTVGRIVYEVQAVIVRISALKINKSASGPISLTAHIPRNGFCVRSW